MPEDLTVDDASRLHERLRSLMTGYKLSQALYVVARLRIADLLSDRPRNVEDLARATETDARSLYRVLRLLGAAGFFAESGGDFRLTALGELLISDAPHSDRAWILKEGELWWEAWSHLLESVQSGRPGFDLVHGKGLFDYLADAGTTDVARRTLAALSSAGTDRQVQSILEAYDFGAAATVVDVGGGDGSLLFGALRGHPRLRGILFDLPYVVNLARSSAEPGRTADRCEFVGGSFFESVPTGGDLYVLRSILHDWDDAEALSVLENCRRAMPANGNILVIEVLMTEADESDEDRLSAALRDVNLMVMTSGRKRTFEELRLLLSAARFETRRVIPLETRFSIIEATTSDTDMRR